MSAQSLSYRHGTGEALEVICVSLLEARSRTTDGDILTHKAVSGIILLRRFRVAEFRLVQSALAQPQLFCQLHLHHICLAGSGALKSSNRCKSLFYVAIRAPP